MRLLDFMEDPEYPQFASDLKFLKADKMEGERESEIELGR